MSMVAPQIMPFATVRAPKEISPMLSAAAPSELGSYTRDGGKRGDEGIVE